MKVLIGIDGSRKSLDAIPFACRLLSPSQDRIVFYYSPPNVRIYHEEDLIPSIPADLREKLVKDVLDEAHNVLPKSFHEQLKTIQGERKPADGLLLAAEQSQADLIVVGADAKWRNMGPFLGGVARTVAREASVPVLVVRQSPSAKQEGPFRVLLAHDGTLSATQAGEQLTQFSWPVDSQGWIVRVMEWIDIRMAVDPSTTPVWKEDYIQHQEKTKALTKQAIIEASSRMPEFFHHEPPLVEQGSPVRTICDVAASKQADLLVVSPHNQGVARRIVGATTESLLHYAPCSVLVAHQPDNP